MRPKASVPGETGVLEFLEDIIGSSKFVAPIVAAQAEMEGLNETRAQCLTRVKAAEKDKEALEGAKGEAEE